jgi:heme-degrading monooxygenase HmoA
VKPGREDDFVARWRRLAEEAMAELEPPERPWLLRDRDRPNVFVSFGPWESDDQLAAFRASDAFAGAQADLADMLESFEARTLDEGARG